MVPFQVVTEEGLRVIAESSQDQLFSLLIDQIVFCCVVNDAGLQPLKGKIPAWKRNCFCLIHTNASGRTQCDVFSAGKRARVAMDGVYEAKSITAERRATAGPFDPVSRTPSLVEGPLAQFQVCLLGRMICIGNATVRPKVDTWQGN